MSQFNGQKILVVEDNHISYKLIEAHLKGRNLQLIHATDGLAALDKYEHIPDIALVLMDIQLPKLNGLDVTRQIRKTNQDITIIATTANVFDEDKIACEEAGCTNFISKPIDFPELFELLTQYLH